VNDCIDRASGSDLELLRPEDCDGHSGTCISSPPTRLLTAAAHTLD
jgi:hypothetical protein